MTSVSARDVLAMRMRAQLLSPALSPPPGGSHDANGPDQVARVARHLLALQGQDAVAGHWALGLRAGVDRATVFDALRNGSVVRSWPMRGTVHFVAAEDIGWLQTLTNDRVMVGHPRRLAQLGLDLTTLERMRTVAIARLEGGRSATRAELLQAFEDAGIALGSGWAYHSIWYLAQTGTLVFGPPAGPREALLVLADEWITAPRELEGDEALAEVAARFAAGHGPVSMADLGWWTKLTVASVKRAFGIAEADGTVMRLEGDDDVPLWAAADADVDLGDEPPPLLLLPAFDELILGYRDRAHSLDPARAADVWTVNGLARPIVVREGRVVGIWSLRGAAFEERIFDEELPIDSASVTEQAARVIDFYS